MSSRRLGSCLRVWTDKNTKETRPTNQHLHLHAHVQHLSCTEPAGDYRDSISCGFRFPIPGSGDPSLAFVCLIGSFLLLSHRLFCPLSSLRLFASSTPPRVSLVPSSPFQSFKLRSLPWNNHPSPSQRSPQAKQFLLSLFFFGVAVLTLVAFLFRFAHVSTFRACFYYLATPVANSGRPQSSFFNFTSRRDRRQPGRQCAPARTSLCSRILPM
jgi:hypothetical protein